MLRVASVGLVEDAVVEVSSHEGSQQQALRVKDRTGTQHLQKARSQLRTELRYDISMTS